MWIPREQVEQLKNELDLATNEAARAKNANDRLREQARQAVNRALARAEAAERQSADLIQKLMDLERRPPTIIPPPDTAQIVKEAINGVATIVNGWKETAVASIQNPAPVQLPLSMDALGMDDRAGIPNNMDDFVPPWENMGPPSRAGWVNPPTNGNYTPYIPGEGNTAPPAGGIE